MLFSNLREIPGSDLLRRVQGLDVAPVEEVEDLGEEDEERYAARILANDKFLDQEYP